MNPEAAVEAHLAVQGRRMLPVHWGTFKLGFHDWQEPIIRAVEAAKHKKVELVTPRVGELVIAGQICPSSSWWEGLE
jgi:L-ascorbate metabolism protein UlaG (beta-lactamase superfamily)